MLARSSRGPPRRRAERGVGAVKLAAVIAMILASGVIMALAWLAHLRFRDKLSFWAALAMSWAMVLPEYMLNVAATRYGYGTLSGSQMASLHLASGVVSVALVARFVLDEPFQTRQLLGLALLGAGLLLVLGGTEPT